MVVAYFGAGYDPVSGGGFAACGGCGSFGDAVGGEAGCVEYEDSVGVAYVLALGGGAVDKASTIGVVYDGLGVGEGSGAGDVA